MRRNEAVVVNDHLSTHASDSPASTAADDDDDDDDDVVKADTEPKDVAEACLASATMASRSR